MKSILEAFKVMRAFASLTHSQEKTDPIFQGSATAQARTQEPEFQAGSTTHGPTQSGKPMCDVRVESAGLPDSEITRHDEKGAKP